MPVVLLPGNHDPILPDCLYRRAGVTDFTHVHVLGVTHDTVLLDALDLEIHGIPHRGFGDMVPLGPVRARRLHRQVVIAHGHCVPPTEWSTQAHRSWKFSDAEVAQTGANYVALGHWDRAAAVGDGRVPAWYSGSPDLAGTVNVVRLGDATLVERMPLDWRA